MTSYNVYRAADGSDPEFCGEASSLRAAKKLAAQSARTGRRLEKSLWDTARAAGHCGGLSAPEGVEADEPRAWFGRRGEYCAVEVV